LFVNIGRDDYCAWVDGGFIGPPPVDETISVKLSETGKGAVVASFQGDLKIELWRLDPDVPPLVDPCVDTDAQSGPWATGSAHVEANDNDFDGSRTRTNSFGVRGQGTVMDATGGTWHFSWTNRIQITKDDVPRACSELQPAPDRVAVALERTWKSAPGGLSPSRPSMSTSIW